MLIFANEMQMLSNIHSAEGFGLGLHVSLTFSHLVLDKIISLIEQLIDKQVFN